MTALTLNWVYSTQINWLPIQKFKKIVLEKLCGVISISQSSLCDSLTLYTPGSNMCPVSCVQIDLRCIWKWPGTSICESVNEHVSWQQKTSHIEKKNIIFV